MKKLFWVKRNLAKEFEKWCNERLILAYTIDDVVEFLMQKGFIQGKKWLDYIDSLPEITPHEYLTTRREALRDGFIDPESLIGRWKG